MPAEDHTSLLFASPSPDGGAPAASRLLAGGGSGSAGGGGGSSRARAPADGMELWAPGLHASRCVGSQQTAVLHCQRARRSCSHLHPFLAASAPAGEGGVRGQRPCPDVRSWPRPAACRPACHLASAGPAATLCCRLVPPAARAHQRRTGHQPRIGALVGAPCWLGGQRRSVRRSGRSARSVGGHRAAPCASSAACSHVHVWPGAGLLAAHRPLRRGRQQRWQQQQRKQQQRCLPDLLLRQPGALAGLGDRCVSTPAQAPAR